MTIIRKVILLFFFLFLFAFADGQPLIQWQKTYGGSLNDRGYSICKTSDGCFMIAGVTSSVDGDVSINHGQEDLWLIKIDSTGSIIFEKALGGSRLEEANRILPITDNGFIVFGYTTSNDNDVSGIHVSPVFLHMRKTAGL